jgi:hypothetical protein
MAEWPPQLVSKIMSDELLIENARVYARRRQLQLAERLGFGIHGIVFSAENKSVNKVAASFYNPGVTRRRERFFLIAP